MRGILVNCVSSHNFISRGLVEAIGWQLETTKSMRILMGGGHNRNFWSVL